MRAERCLRTWPAPLPALLTTAVLVVAALMAAPASAGPAPAGVASGGPAAGGLDGAAGVGPVAAGGTPTGTPTGTPASAPVGASADDPGDRSGGGSGSGTGAGSGSDAGSEPGGRPGGEADGSGGVPPPVPVVGRAWPVGSHPSVTRGWEPPATAYGRGHRGVDLAAAPGAPVRAVAPGRVSFAGRVAGRGVVSVELTGTGEPPLRTTYEPVRATSKKGTEVAAGEVVGVLEPAGPHCPASCLHWGLRRADTYLDPLSLLPPWLLGRDPSRLLPVTGVPRTPTAHRVHEIPGLPARP